jgi:hypothetical protein
MSGPIRTCPRRLPETHRVCSVFDGEPCQIELEYSPFTLARHIDGLTVYVSTDYEYHWCIVRRILVPTAVVWTVLLSTTTLFAGQSASPSGDSGKSLGDIAKQVRPKDAKVTTKHVFTDDDVAHGADPGLLTTHSDSKSTLEDAQKVIDTAASLNSRQVGQSLVGENRFPGRDAWEDKLYQQRQKVIAAAQMAVDYEADQKHKIKTESDRTTVQAGLRRLLAELSVEQDRYERIVAEGIGQAAAWEKRSR